MAASERAYSSIDPASLLERVVWLVHDRITSHITWARQTSTRLHASARSGAADFAVIGHELDFMKGSARVSPVARVIGSGLGRGTALPRQMLPNTTTG